MPWSAPRAKIQRVRHRPAKKRTAPVKRRSAWQRGYDAAWRRVRRLYLERFPRCHDCKQQATEVHHINKVSTHPELRLRYSNLMGLCKPCHSTRTGSGE